MPKQAAQCHEDIARLHPELCQIYAGELFISTNGAECNGCGSQPDQATIASVRLMNSVSVIVAQMFNYLLDFVVVFIGARLSNKPFKSAAIELSN